MLYSLFLLTFGIYLGQEYPSIPNIKSISVNLLQTLQNANVNQNNAQRVSRQDKDEFSFTLSSLTGKIRELLN